MQDMTPEVAYGLTANELILTWLAAYAAIYAFFSLIGYFIGEYSIKGVTLYLIFDCLAFLLSITLFFSLPLIKIEVSNFTQTETLSTLISDVGYKTLMLLGMGSGIILQIFKMIIMRYRKKRQVLTLDKFIKN